MKPTMTRPWLEWYAPGVPADIDVQTETLVDLVENASRRFRTRVAVEFFGATTSYGELEEQIARAAEGLRRLGVSRGDRVALVLPNCPQHVVAFYAVLRLGAIVIEHNPLYTARELRHQFEDHGARVAIVWDKTYETLTGFPSDLALKTIIQVDMTEAMPWTKRVALKLPIPAARASRQALSDVGRHRKRLTFDRLTAARRISRRHPRPKPSDIALLQYTSGTSGRPKGAMLSHANLRSNAAQGRAWVPGLQDGKEVFFGVLPLFHAYGLTLCLTFALSIGARLVLFPKFDVDLVLAAQKKTPATFLPAVPPIYDQLARAAAKRGVSLKSIRFAISGAMSLPVSTVERWEQQTGGLLIEGYGMTETSPVALGNPLGPARRPGTVGVPFPSTYAKVVDPADPSIERAPDEQGELMVRGPQVFSGYWNNPAETAAALTEDGWLRTGDIVTMSADGFVTVVDRIKELIITGGFNVAPSEVEETIVKHPDVVDAAVVGLPRADGGETVAAAVILRPGALLDVDGMREFCRRSLAGYKVPKVVVAVPELPRSLIGKVLRRSVRDQLMAE